MASSRSPSQLLAQCWRVPLTVVAALGENDRSSTGYLAKSEFEAAADRFFAAPDSSFRGWETAHAAQTRIVRAMQDILRAAPAGDIALTRNAWSAIQTGRQRTSEV
jgi:broad specificity phosphatase PhoE